MTLLSHAKTCYKSRTQWSWRFMYQRLLWDIPEIVGPKDRGWLIQENNKSLDSSSNFQNWHTPKFGK